MATTDKSCCLKHLCGFWAFAAAAALICLVALSSRGATESGPSARFSTGWPAEPPSRFTSPTDLPVVPESKPRTGAVAGDRITPKPWPVLIDPAADDPSPLGDRSIATAAGAAFHAPTGLGVGRVLARGPPAV